MAELEHADLLIEGGSVVTMDNERRIIRDGAIAVEGDKIVAVGKRNDVRAKFRAVRSISGGHRVTFPGFVNAHVHFYPAVHRGMSPDSLPGTVWSKFIHSNFAPLLSPEDEIWAARFMLMEFLKSGTTTFLAAGSYYPLAVLDAIAGVGLRGFEGRRTFDYVDDQADLVDDTPTALRENERVMEEFVPRADKLVQPCVNIVGLGRCTDELIVRAKELADKHHALLNMHQCAFPAEVESVKRRTGYTPIERLEKLGVLGPNVVLVHMIHVTDREIEILSQTRTNVVHCPHTALRIRHGLSRGGKFPEMIAAGVNVALATDDPDCSNTMDMVRAMYLAAVLFKDIRYDSTLMGAETALEMGTINGARAVGMEDSIGSIEPGKKADLVLFDTDNVQWQPLHCEPYNLVYSATGDTADTVIVDGKVIMENREVKTFDEAEVLARLRQVSDDIVARSGIGPPTPWPIL